MPRKYESKQGEGKSWKEMFGLAWDVKKLSDMNEIVECTTLVDKLLDPNYDGITNNLANQISTFRESPVLCQMYDNVPSWTGHSYIGGTD